jgi:hypothetical protein
VDIRGEGAYVVAPPSIHATGCEYKFLEPSSAIAAIPERLLRALANPPVSPTSTGTFVEGERNTRLTSITGTLVRQGVSGERLDRIVTHVNQEVCEPPLDTGEVRRINRSVEHYRQSPRMAASASITTAGPGTEGSNRYTLYSVDELFTLEPPEWLIEGLMPTRALAVHFGPSASAKSFVALDWALSIATGRDWCGRKVKPGPVIYVVGEGTSGISRRVSAWMLHHGVDRVPDAFFLLQAPVLMSPADVTALVSAIRQRSNEAALIVFDTLARAFVGGEENSAKDMGLLVGGCQQLQIETGATVLVIHHAGKPKGKKAAAMERGSSALRAAAEVVIAQSKKGDLVTVENEKQKDDEQFPAIKLRMRVLNLGVDEKTGKPITSCVLVPADGIVPDVQVEAPRSNGSELLALDTLEGLREASSGEWHKWIGDMGNAPVAERTFHHWREELLKQGLVECIDSAKHVYRCTEKGRTAVAAAKAAKRQPADANGSPIPACHATTP